MQKITGSIAIETHNYFWLYIIIDVLFTKKIIINITTTYRVLNIKHWKERCGMCAGSGGAGDGRDTPTPHLTTHTCAIVTKYGRCKIAS